MVPYTYYRLCESYRDTDGKVKQRTVLGLGELLDLPTELERKELAGLLTEMINEGTFRLCDKPELYDAAIGFYGKWLEEKKEAQERRDRLAEIQTALGIPALPVCSIKSVWLRERPLEKDPPSKSGG